MRDLRRVNNALICHPIPPSPTFSYSSADTAFDFFVEAYGVKYDRAAKCLIKDRSDLFARLTISRPSIGSISAPRTQLRAPSPLSGIAQPRPKAVSAAKRRWPPLGSMLRMHPPGHA